MYVIMAWYEANSTAQRNGEYFFCHTMNAMDARV